MSSISNWVSDYPSGGDSNFPQDAEPIPFPVDGHGDLGFVLRDIKAVTRGQTLDRLFEPDTRAATYVSSTSFTCAGDLRATYPVGIAVQFVLAGGTVYTWIKTATFGAGVTTCGTSTAVLTNPITSVRFSALKPGSSAAAAANTYPDGIGAPFAYRLGQRGFFQISDPGTTAAVEFLHTEIDTNYRVFIQAISQSGASANGSYRYIDITKTTTGFTLTIGAAPGGGFVNVYEFQLVRGT